MFFISQYTLVSAIREIIRIIVITKIRVNVQWQFIS
jgi:hypothetical protein